MQKNTYKFHIGIDVSKGKLDISSSGPGGEFSVAEHSPVILSVAKDLSQLMEDPSLRSG